MRLTTGWALPVVQHLGAHITFKAYPDLEITKWGLCMVSSKQHEMEKIMKAFQFGSFPFSEGCQVNRLPFNYVHERRGNSGPKIQLPYNWLVTDEEEYENVGAKEKEDNLSNVGLQPAPVKGTKHLPRGNYPSLTMHNYYYY